MFIIELSRYVLQITALLSMISSVMFIATYAMYKTVRTTQNQIIMWTGVCIIFSNVGMILGPLLEHSEYEHAQYALIHGMLLASSLWTLMLSINLVRVIYLGESPEAIKDRFYVYHMLVWPISMFFPLLCIFLGKSIVMEHYPFPFLMHLDAFLYFLLPLWFVGIANIVLYVILGYKIWWTSGNSRGNIHGRMENGLVQKIFSSHSAAKSKYYLRTTGELVYLYMFLVLIPSIEEVACILNFTYSPFMVLKSFAIGIFGFVMVYLMARWSFSTNESLKDYVVHEYQELLQQKDPDYIMDENIPLLTKTKSNQIVAIEGEQVRALVADSDKTEDSPIPVGTIVRVVFEFEPTKSDELHLRQGDSLLILESPSGGWLRGTNVLQNSVIGWFPANHVQAFKQKEPVQRLQTHEKNDSFDSLAYIDTDTLSIKANNGNVPDNQRDTFIRTDAENYNKF